MLKWWPTFIFALVLLLFFANYVPKEQRYLQLLSDGCLVYALHTKMVMESNDLLEPFLWSRIIGIEFYGALGHAINVFVYKNQTFVYDPARGSFRVAAYPLYDPLTIAEICYPKVSIKKVYFLEPTMLLHDSQKAPKMLEWNY
jgi:hypothetical protein